MLELFIVAAALFFGGIYLFKFFFFLFGLFLSGFGFVIKAVFTVVLAVFFFPVTLVLVGGILSSGVIGLILIVALIGALGQKRDRQASYY